MQLGSHLTSLSISDCPLLSPAILSTLPVMPQLRSLQFRHCGAADECVVLPERVPRLEELCLAGQRVTDHGAGLVSGFATLKTLDLSGTALTAAGVSALAPLSALESLDISWPSDTSTAIYPPPLPRLRVLRMDGCTLGGEWLEAYTLHASVYGAGSLFTTLTELSVGGAARAVVSGDPVRCKHSYICDNGGI